MEESQDRNAQLTAEIEQIRKELEQTRAAHAHEQRSRIVREVVGAAIDQDVAALLVERALSTAGVPAAGAELPAAARKAVDQVRRDKPWLFENTTRAAPGRTAIAAPEPQRDSDDPAIKAAADHARSSGDRRSLITYLSLRGRRE